MKKIKSKFITILLILSLIGNVAFVLRIPQRILQSLKSTEQNVGNNIIYLIRSDVFENIAYAYDVDIDFVGDSITDNCDYNTLFPDYKVVNQGINGDGIIGLQNRIDSIINTNAKYIFIEIGINDIISFKTQNLFEKYSLFINELSKKMPDSIIYIESVYPVKSDSDYSKYTSKINELNQNINLLSDKNVKYLDVYSELSKHQDIYINDGLHLNQKGYNIVSDIIKSELSAED